MEGLIALAVLLVIVLIVLVNCIKIVPQAHAMVIERLGGYLTTWSVGLHLKVPFIDRIAKKVILKEQVVDFPPQPVITKDNVTMQIDTVVYFQITDPKLYAYGVENPIMAIENLTATTLRNIIGDLELDETLTSRETINTKMRATLDVATDPWGIKVRDERPFFVQRVRKNQQSLLQREIKSQSSSMPRLKSRQPSFEQRQRRRQQSRRQQVRQRLSSRYSRPMQTDFAC